MFKCRALNWEWGTKIAPTVCTNLSKKLLHHYVSIVLLSIHSQYQDNTGFLQIKCFKMAFLEILACVNSTGFDRQSHTVLSKKRFTRPFPPFTFEPTPHVLHSV